VYVGNPIALLHVFSMDMDIQYQDDGWREELVGGAKSRTYRALDTALVDKGLVARNKGTLYMYLFASNCWSTIAVEEAQRQICDIVGSENVSVSYLGAVRPFVPYLTKCAPKIGSMPTSICLGTYRYRLSRTNDGIELDRCDGIVSTRQEVDSRVTGFCILPCSFYRHPRIWTPRSNCILLKYLSALFIDKTEFETFMWIMGLSVVDPGTYSKFLLFYGPGGTGKSEIVGSVLEMAPGCTGTIKVGQLTSQHVDMTVETACTIAASRLVTTGELNLKSGKLNLHVLKEITGHDSVSIPPVRVSTRCSVISSSNGLPNPSEQDEWLSTAVARRAVVVPMNVKASLLPKVERPDSDDDCLDALLACANVFVNNSAMPISLRSCMYSILGSRHDEIMAHVAIDDDATDVEIVNANVTVSSMLDIPVSLLVELAWLRSQTCVKYLGRDMFIRGLRPVESQ
jgi:hypothetical protein